MIYARQSTAIIVTVGPVLDASGVAVTDCVVADFKASKNGGAPAALNGSATLTHRFTGQYSLSLTATDVNTVGTVEICIDDTTNTCGIKEIQVVEPAVYDAFYADAATGAVPIAANGLSLASVNADAHILFGIIESGTAQSASATGLVLRSAAAFADNVLVGTTLFAQGSTQGYWQERAITANALSGDTTTVDTWNQTPSGTVTYYIFGTAPASATNPTPVDVVEWLGSAVAATTVAGYPKVDVSYGNGIALGQANSLHVLGDNVGALTYTGVGGPGVTYTGASGFSGAKFAGTAAGNGVEFRGGSTNNTVGIYATTSGTNGYGAHFLGVGARQGVLMQGGATGYGLALLGGSTSGGALILQNTSGDVLTITGSSTIGATTFASVAVTGALTAGSVAVSGALTAGATTVASFTSTGALTAGATTLASVTVSGALAAGAVTFSSVTVPGTVNISTNLVVGGSFTVDGATTLTGAIQATNAGNDVRGVRLGATGLDSISATAPTTVASTFREKILQVWERFFGKVVADANTTSITVMQGTGSTPQTTQSYTSAGGIDTINRAS